MREFLDMGVLVENIDLNVVEDSISVMDLIWRLASLSWITRLVRILLVESSETYGTQLLL